MCRTSELIYRVGWGHIDLDLKDDFSEHMDGGNVPASGPASCANHHQFMATYIRVMVTFVTMRACDSYCLF